MFVKKKPVDDTPLKFAPMGAKPIKKKVLQRVKPDVENAADAKKPGDAAEDAADKSGKKTKKAPAKPNKFAAKAAAALAARK